MVVRFLFLVLFFYSFLGFSQITVTNGVPFNTEESIVNVLVDNQLEISNFSSVGFQQGIGYFDGFNSNIGFDAGVILSTGGLNFVTAGGFGGGSGVSGDSDLEDALGAINLNWDVYNVTILEFDFVAGDEIVEFNYVFGSEEYAQYTCSQYNDIFGFFLSGPGIAGPYSNNAVNLAYIPDPDNPGEYTNTPVAVNTVNSGSASGFYDPQTCADIDPNWQDYSIYWVDNAAQPTVQGINGFTVPFKAEYTGLICGETYHIKLAIADASDSAVNSVVFLEAGSFTSPEVQINPISNINGPEVFGDDDAVYEGCSPTQLEFISENSEYNIYLEVQTDGVAEYGEDFEITYQDGTPLDPCPNDDIDEDGILNDEDPDMDGDGIPNWEDDNIDGLVPCILIEAGQEVLYVNVQAFYDEQEEGIEDLLVMINAMAGVCQQANLTVSEIPFNLYDQISMQLDPGEPEIVACVGDEVVFEPSNISGGYILESGDYTYEWYNGSGDQIGSEETLSVIYSGDTEYQLIVYDDCQNQMVAGDFSVSIQEYDDIVIMPVSVPENPCYGDVVELTANPDGGSLDYSYVWAEDLAATNSSYNYTFESGSAQQIVDVEIIDNCTGQPYIFPITIDLVTLDPITNISTPDPVCYGDVVVIESNPDGGSGDYSYLWPDSSEPCDCSTYDEYVFNEEGGEEQIVTFEIIDNCTNESFEQSVVVSLDTNSPEPETTINPNGEQICPGDEIELVVEASGNSTYSYQWADIQTLTSPQIYSTSDVITVSPEEDTTYWVWVIDECNNYSHGPYDYTVVIPVYDDPTFDLLDYSGCEGDQKEIVPQNMNSFVEQDVTQYTYLWSTGATTPTLTVTIGEEAEEYTLTLYDRCGNPGVLNVDGDVPTSEVTVSQPPEPVFVFDQDQNQIQFIQMTDGIFTEFEWDFDNDGTIDSYDFEPLHTYDEEGNYTVVLKAYDDLGCTNSYNAIINIYTTLFFYAPDVFTPNGDGVNESFNVSVVGHKEEDFELLIFDRWGNQLFYTQDPNTGWDGTYPNGKEVPQDIYMYKATMIKSGTEDKTLKKGRISIVK